MVALTWFTTALGLFISLNGEATGRFAQRAVGKTLASVSFIGAGWFSGLPGTPHGQWGMVALVFGLIGDLALLSDDRRVFLFGLLAFLLGHVAYAVALLQLPIGWPAAVLGGAALLAIGSRVVTWTRPGAGRLVPAVAAYVAVIAVMVALAVGAAAATPHHTVLAFAAVLFAASDIAVARNRFVAPGLINRLVGLPMYYVAQLLFVAGLAGVS